MNGSAPTVRAGAPDAGVATAAPIDAVDVTACRIPTDAPYESDGTLSWDHTTVVLVRVRAGGVDGLGWTYAGPGAGHIAAEALRPVLLGADALATRARWDDMAAALRNEGLPGAGAMAWSACDVALWDLRARALGASVIDLLGRARDAVPLYGSGGFCSYDDDRLTDQLGTWVDSGIPRVKMKVGRHPDDDPRRVAVARRAIGPVAELYVDANGAHGVRRACGLGVRYAASGVSWYEEPVSSDDVAGLRRVRDALAAAGTPMDVTAGEYGWSPWALAALGASGAVDVVQPDVTRCGGFTGFLAAAEACAALQVPVSAHCAPQLAAVAGAAAPGVRHVEWFHDHVRVEGVLFPGALRPVDGALHPRSDVVGHGLEVDADAVEFHLSWSDTT